MKKKLSLITLQYINNYGSVLQTYASQMYFENKGLLVETVNYTRENCRFQNLKKSMRAYYKQKNRIFRIPFVSDMLVLRWNILYRIRNKVFEKFRGIKIKLSNEYFTSQDLMCSPPEADYYCVGSDQVWNYLYNDGVLPEYFLQYAPVEAKRFSFSSSLGLEKVEEEANCALIKQYLDNFSLVTVRENSAKKALEEIGVERCHQILDPTLLISKEEWISELGLKLDCQEKYVLVYQLNPCAEMDNFAREIATKHNYKLIIISNNIRLSVPGAKIIRNPTVERFLELILNAQYVVTDSFHGTAFSLNFNRQIFSWMPGKYSTRLMSVLELLGLQERAFTKNEKRWEKLPDIDYDSVNNVLVNERKRAAMLIEEVFNDD